MDKLEISKHRNSINKYLDRRELILALRHLALMVEASQQWELEQELKRLTTSYRYMLQYLTQGVLDPQRDNILSQIMADAYELTDKTVISLAASQSTHLFYKRHLHNKDISLQNLIRDYLVEANKVNLLASTESDTEAIGFIKQRCETIETEIFNHVWSVFPISHADLDTLVSVLGDSKFPMHLKSLVLSAMMLGLSKFFDASKLKLLLDCYAFLDDEELKLRSLINAVIIIYLYRKRIGFYPAITEALKRLESQPHFEGDLQLIFTRLIHTRNTDNLSRKVKETFMPELEKMNPELLNKIKGRAPGAIDIAGIEENPQWQEWLDNSGITRKIEELNEIHLQGGDVFISTFSQLKNFPFFNTLSNWFLPYHDNSYAVSRAFGGKRHPLTEIFKFMPFLCDSDKYSMLFYIASTPESQRNMMFQQIEAQREQFKELLTEQEESVVKKRDSIVNLYIQDLYRFFKLFSRRREFKSIFDTDINLTEALCLRPYISHTPTLSLIAEFYFKNGFYDDAIKFYGLMVSNHDANPHAYQKMGYAHQAMGRYREAIKNYSRYEIAEGDDVWNTKQMAQCYRQLHEHDKAIEHFKKALEMSPESVNLCLNLGHCYLDRNDYDNALKLYYKADFMPRAKHRAWRPIAWCSLLTGKSEQALNYYDKIVTDDSPTSQDHLNYGHVLQVMGRLAEAVEQYRKALTLDGNKPQDFARLYMADAKYIVGTLGVSPSDYALVLDATLQSYNNQ